VGALLLFTVRGWSSSLISKYAMNTKHWLVIFKISFRYSEITNISCKYISFLQEFVNVKSFLRGKSRKTC
jgi:hypothetical protein